MKYVIIGSSASGVNACRELRRHDKTAEITMISKDETIYSRCILHHYLGETRTIKELSFAEFDFVEQFNINFMNSCEVISLDKNNKKIITSKGEVSYDKLLIASGAHSLIPNIEGLKTATNAIGFRDISDVEFIKEKAKENVVILGAGLVGLDCTYGLIERGIAPTLIDAENRPLAKQLDEKSAKAYINAMEKRGVKQKYGVKLQKLNMEGDKIVSISLENGEVIPCDLFIVCIGVRPNISFLENSGIEVDKFGLVFDDGGHTSDENIFGAGDVSGRAYIWPIAVKQGMIAALNMATKDEHKLSDFFTSKSTMNFNGIPTMSLGNAIDEEGNEVEILENETSYKKIIHKDGKILGAILQGDLAYSGILQQLIMHKINISKIKKTIFNIDYSDFFNMDKNFEYYYDI